MKHVITALLAASIMSCSSMDSIPFAEWDRVYAHFVESEQLEETEAIANIINVGWNALTNRYLIVNANIQRDEFYLVEFKNTCYRLQELVFVSSPFGRNTLSKNERVFIVAENSWPCEIKTIYPLATDQQLALIQLSRALRRPNSGQDTVPGE